MLAKDENQNDKVLYAAGTTAAYSSGIVAVVFRCSAGGVALPEVIGFYDSNLQRIDSVDLWDLDQQDHSNVLTLALFEDSFEVTWTTNGEPCHFGADSSVPRSGRFTIENGNVATSDLMTGESDQPCPMEIADPSTWIISEDGIGPVTLDSSVAAIDGTIQAAYDPGFACQQLTSFGSIASDPSNVLFTSGFEVVHDVTVRTSDPLSSTAATTPRTAEGITLGSTTEELMHTYPELARSDGESTSLVAPFGDSFLIVELTDGGDFVRGITVSQSPEILGYCE
ncbi:hypothetical protein SAMN04487846_0003 [Microbacterium sp. cf046]|uniref:hypothetical protein n=1 Tax=Microbacterium sp. cf046 TaxID=1761803 RepID=UPI0008F1E392|nr:hypothetical protein [Microbacterium sp. cf046]SFR85609.1 hypothetical protein SAMN04487846_0003 [Microbacterium sp. cf046]